MKHAIPRLIPLAIMIGIVLAATTGVTGPLPPLIDFQSVLLDEGGNLLPSGSTSVQFQILDENRTPIYTEVQSVDVVKGAASALIGNGNDAKGISTGGIPDDIFATGAPRYLQVQVDGRTPEDPMTIVPVPYAQWSQTCATVADGAVKPASIAKAAVGFESLAPDVVGKLAEALGKSQGMMTAQALNASGGASQIGLQTKLINSGSTTVQGALQDIDLSVKKRQEETAFLTGKLNEEVTNRTNAVAGAQSKLDQEVANRTAADGGLQTQITTEAQTRGTVDSGLNQSIVGITNTLSDINNISGKLKLDRLEPNSSAMSNLNMGGKKITNMADPTELTDAATKQYADQAAANAAENVPPPNPATTLIKTGAYQTCGNGNPTPCGDITIDAGIKPTAIQIFSIDPLKPNGDYISGYDYIEFLGIAIDDATIKGWVKTLVVAGNGSVPKQITFPFNSTALTIPFTKALVPNSLNSGDGKKFIYIIFGTTL